MAKSTARPSLRKNRLPIKTPATKAFTIGQVAKALRCHERSARLYLREVNESIDCYASDQKEPIDRQTLIALYDRHAGERLANRLTALLTQ